MSDREVSRLERRRLFKVTARVETYIVALDSDAAEAVLAEEPAIWSEDRVTTHVQEVGVGVEIRSSWLDCYPWASSWDRGEDYTVAAWRRAQCKSEAP